MEGCTLLLRILFYFVFEFTYADEAKMIVMVFRTQGLIFPNRLLTREVNEINNELFYTNACTVFPYTTKEGARNALFYCGVYSFDKLAQKAKAKAESLIANSEKKGIVCEVPRGDEVGLLLVIRQRKGKVPVKVEKQIEECVSEGLEKLGLAETGGIQASKVVEDYYQKNKSAFTK